jgi:bla regulator protein blaR1
MAELTLLAKATIVIGLALAAVAVAPRARAALRAQLMASAFAALIALPVVTMLVPDRTIEVPVAVNTSFQAIDIPAAAVSASTPGGEGPNRPVPWRSPGIATMLRMLWVLMMIGFLARAATSLWRLRIIRRGGVAWNEGAALLSMLADATGVRRRVELFVHDQLDVPMTFGLVRPVIGLPGDALEWPRDAVSRALVHELEHVRRADWAVHLMAVFVCAVYWFHPLVWIAARRLRLESERACDDAVVRNADGATYAQQLVSLARRLTRRNTITVLSIASPGELTTRVRAVLNERQARGRASAVSGTLLAACAAAVVLAISPLRAVSRSPEFAVGDQAPAAGAPLPFDVASVKPNTSATPRQTITQRGNTFVATNVTLKELVATAYQIEQPDLLSGGPGWLDSERFDVEAKSAGSARWDELLQMLQALLADRFGLGIRRENKDVSVYALVVARNGPRLKTAFDGECLAPPQGWCGGFKTAPGSLLGRRVTVSQIARMLSGRSGRRVLDRTQIEGVFDVELQWAPGPGQLPPGPGPDDAPPIDPTRPSLFTAVEEQLGLRLQPSVAPVEHFVIERAERPRSN